MLDLRRGAQRRGTADRLPRLRTGAIRALRPRSRLRLAVAGRRRRARRQHVALRRGDAGEPGRDRDARRGLHATPRGAAAGRETRPRHPAGEGRGREPDRHLQGSRHVRRRLDRPRAGRRGARRADRRERRLGRRGLRRARRTACARGGAQRYASGDDGRGPRVRRGADARRWHDRRRWCTDPRAQRQRRLVRRVDVQGAGPRRGQEDDGLRTLGAAPRRTARCHHLSHRRRHRPRRDVESVRGTPGDGPRRLGAPADGGGPVRGLRADRTGVRRGRGSSRVLGRRRDPRSGDPRAGPLRRRSDPYGVA